MGSWRRQQGEIRQQEVKGTRTQSRKPPLDNWQWDVPKWEKRFCKSVGLPWKKLVDTKNCMYLYENVVNWNDSAGEEAFHNAKSRYWAEFNGRHCDISLPDPDIYIDEVDWSSSIDPDLLLDLEREPKAPVDKVEYGVVDGLYNILGFDQAHWSTGWGEAEEDFQKPNAVFRENGNCDQNVNDGENSWEMNYVPESQVLREKECDRYLNNAVGWNTWENNQNEPGQGFSNETWRTWDPNSKKMGGNWCHSTFQSSRFHNDGYRRENGWRNRRGRRW